MPKLHILCTTIWKIKRDPIAPPPPPTTTPSSLFLWLICEWKGVSVSYTVVLLVLTVRFLYLWFIHNTDCPAPIHSGWSVWIVRVILFHSLTFTKIKTYTGCLLKIRANHWKPSRIYESSFFITWYFIGLIPEKEIFYLCDFGWGYIRHFLCPVVQSPVSANPGLTLDKSNRVSPVLSLIKLWRISIHGSFSQISQEAS